MNALLAKKSTSATAARRLLVLLSSSHSLRASRLISTTPSSDASAAATATSATSTAYPAVPAKPLFDKILVANRGEVAVRVFRTARRLGIKTVAVYSDADAQGMHTQYADEAIRIGPAPSGQSYLNADAIVNAVRATGAQAVHPGWGFLSENPHFAGRLHRDGVVFIGPPESAMIAMASKAMAKDIMIKAGVPVVPGYHGTEQSPEFLAKEAERIGYPVLIKAVMGGGGKGMRVVEHPRDFMAMLDSARHESIKSFGDDRVLVEKYIKTPRHVEVQVFADSHGNVVHLFERDCSVQRRHQKILEEAPAPHLSEAIRTDLGEKAVAAVRAVDYLGAGTVEFIFDNDENKFYYMETNTRLQVEHPISEMITGTDLVQWQLEVAAGNPLPIPRQKDIHRRGHAMEARIYAENPNRGFLPDTGPLVHLRTPAPAPGVVRLETGVREGDLVSVHYDPMIAKVVVHGHDRADAIRRLSKALSEYEVAGVSTNIEFLQDVLAHDAFIEGNVETGFIGKYGKELFAPKRDPSAHDVVQAAIALVFREQRSQQLAHRGRDVASNPHSRWAVGDGFRLNSISTSTIHLELPAPPANPVLPADTPIPPAVQFKVEIDHLSPTEFAARVYRDGELAHTFDRISTRIATATTSRAAPNSAVSGPSTTVDTECIFPDRTTAARVVHIPHASPLNPSTDTVHVFSNTSNTTNRVSFVVPAPKYKETLLKESGSSGGGGSVRTPMPCKVARVMVKDGEKVEIGTPLIVLEAMKMEHLIKSPVEGVIKKVIYKEGDMVEEGKNLVSFVEEESS
ncbi:hypothetical protein GQ42DRAFT_162138 [Ramicandelaber brevisporus]|nr:hypothetical protein GQ42DRAFT_162138 [Ramicandelaber brevisporus]